MTTRAEKFPHPPDMKKSPPGGAGVQVEVDGSSTTYSSRPSGQTQYLPCANECAYRLGRALRKGRIARDDWGFGFTLSILGHQKRRGWIPTPKQLATMRRLVAELAEPESLIDEADHAAA